MTYSQPANSWHILNILNWDDLTVPTEIASLNICLQQSFWRWVKKRQIFCQNVIHNLDITASGVLLSKWNFMSLDLLYWRLWTLWFPELCPESSIECGLQQHSMAFLGGISKYFQITPTGQFQELLSHIVVLDYYSTKICFNHFLCFWGVIYFGSWFLEVLICSQLTLSLICCRKFQRRPVFRPWYEYWCLYLSRFVVKREGRMHIRKVWKKSKFPH